MLVKDEESDLTELIPEERKPSSSIGKQRAIVFTVFMLLFFTMTFESCAFPFYPQEANRKGLSSTEIGLVFAAYDAARVLSAPVAGSMVSLVNRK